MKRAWNFTGLILFLLGGLWALQGIGVVGGSFMTGQTSWLVIGVGTMAAGVAVLISRNCRW